MSDVTKETTYENQLIEIGRLMGEFRERFHVETKDANNFMTISRLESMWLDLQINAQNIFSDMVRDLMSDVDEGELIRKKKHSMQTKE